MDYRQFVPLYKSQAVVTKSKLVSRHCFPQANLSSERHIQLCPEVCNFFCSQDLDTVFELASSTAKATKIGTMNDISLKSFESLIQGHVQFLSHPVEPVVFICFWQVKMSTFLLFLGSFLSKGQRKLLDSSMNGSLDQTQFSILCFVYISNLVINPKRGYDINQKKFKFSNNLGDLNLVMLF